MVAAATGCCFLERVADCPWISAGGFGCSGGRCHPVQALVTAAVENGN